MNLDHRRPEPDAGGLHRRRSPASRATRDPDCELVIAEARAERGSRDPHQEARGDGVGGRAGRQHRLERRPPGGRPRGDATCRGRRQLKDHLLFGLGAIRAENHHRACGVVRRRRVGRLRRRVPGPRRVAAGPKFYCSSLVWWATSRSASTSTSTSSCDLAVGAHPAAAGDADELVSREDMQPRYLRPPPVGAVHAIYSPRTCSSPTTGTPDGQGRRRRPPRGDPRGHLA